MKKYLAHILFIAIFGGVFWLGGGSASAATITWDGGGDGVFFSDPLNWSPDFVPVNGDDLVFDFASFSDQDTLNNDIVDLELVQIAVTGDNSANSYITVNLEGNTISTANIDFFDDANAVNWRINFNNIDIDLNLTSDVTANRPGTFNSINLNSYDITFSASGDPIYLMTTNLSGSGSITVQNEGSFSIYNPATANNAFTGTIAVSGNSSLSLHSAAAAGNASSIQMNDGSSLRMAKDTNIYSMSLTLSGGGQDYGGDEPIAKISAYPILGAGGGGSPSEPDGTVTLGSVTLMSDVDFEGHSNLVVNEIVGDFTINIRDGSVGGLTLPGGTKIDSEDVFVKIDAGDNQPTLAVFIDTNEVYEINGTRGNIDLFNGTLRGNGTVGTINVSGGRIEPGQSPGCLTASSISSGAVLGVLQIEIAGLTACSEYDQLILSGGASSSNISGLSLEVVHLNGFASNGDDVFVIVNNQSANPITGTFDGLADGSTFVSNGMTYRISYSGGDGNDITLTRVAVPGEPTTGIAPQVSSGTLALLAAGLSLMAVSGTLLYKRR